MALAGRSARRGGAGVRWLAVGIILTLLVLLIDAALNSRSSTPQEELSAGAWIDKVLPIVSTSTDEGEELAGVWANGLHMPASQVATEVDQIASGASSAYQSAIQLKAPVALSGASGLLVACLLARSEAAAQLKTAFTQTVANRGNASPPVNDVQTAGSDLQVGDSAYLLFAKTVPANLGVTMPPSRWVSDPGLYQGQTAEAYLSGLQAAAISTPVHEIKIYSVATDPGPVGTSGAIEILPDATAITLTIVVADVGNQAELNMTVTASISTAGSGGASSVRDFVNLEPGQAHSILGLGPLNPPEGTPVTVTVTVSPPAGSPTPVVTKTFQIKMPAPPPPTTTTTVGSPPTT